MSCCIRPLHTYTFENTKKFSELIEYSKFFKTLVFDEDCYSVIKDLNGFEAYVKSHEFECIDIDEIGDSHNFKAAEASMSSSVENGIDIEEFFLDKLLDIIAVTKFVTIVDRYLLTNECLKKTSLSLKNFFSILRENKIYLQNITIISSNIDFIGNPPCDVLVREYIEQQISWWNEVCGKFKIVIKKDAYFKDTTHDRYILTDYHLISIGTGLGEVMGKNCIDRVASFKCCKKELDDVAVKLVKQANWCEEGEYLLTFPDK